MVVQAYRFVLDPTPTQEAALRSHCGGQRHAFNWGLALVTAVMDQRAAEASYGISEAELTPTLNWSAYSQRKSWNRAKDAVAPWCAENSAGFGKPEQQRHFIIAGRAEDELRGARTQKHKLLAIGVIVAFVLGLELIILGALR
jgi:putative transposase